MCCYHTKVKLTQNLRFSQNPVCFASAEKVILDRISRRKVAESTQVNFIQ